MTTDNPQTVSLNGAKFICCREAFVGLAYVDGAHGDGTPRYSMGFGSQTPPPKAGDTITIEEAFPRLVADIQTRAGIVNRVLTTYLLQHQFDMLFSLFYQGGSDGLKAVAALYNAGQTWPAIAEFIKFATNAKGEIKTGLIKRRVLEMHISATGDYGDLSQYPYYAGDPRVVQQEWRAFPADLMRVS